MIDLVNDPLPDVKISEEDKKKNLELLEEAKKVSERFLTRRGRKSRSSLSESPTGRGRSWKPDFIFSFKHLQRQTSTVIYTLLLFIYPWLIRRSESLLVSTRFHIEQKWPIHVLRCVRVKWCEITLQCNKKVGSISIEKWKMLTHCCLNEILVARLILLKTFPPDTITLLLILNITIN